MLAADVVHRLRVPLHDTGQLALTARHQPPRASHPMPSLGQPALGGPTRPRADHVFGPGPINRLECLVQTAERLNGRGELVVVRRVLLDVMDEPPGVGDLRPAGSRHVAGDWHQGGHVPGQDETPATPAPPPPPETEGPDAPAAPA